MVLPENVDSTYADSGLDPSVALHQQHHDEIHAAINDLSGTYVAQATTKAAATDDVLTSDVTGDTNDRFVVNADGKIEWGPGNAAADTFLDRFADRVLTINAGGNEALRLGRVLGVNGYAGLIHANQTIGVGNYALAFTNAETLLNATGSGNVYVRIGNSTRVQVNNSTTITPASASNVPLIAKGAASQTAALQDWQNSGGTGLFSIDANGHLKWPAAKEQTTVGAAGGASALPATPTKYLHVKDSAGTTLVIPAYAAS